MYTGYLTGAEYADLGYNDIPADELTKYLIKASREIDALTFNRIVHFGFENLTDFQKDIIQTVICEHANFLYENHDILIGVLGEWSFNGVSMKFGDAINIVQDCGVIIEASTYALLKQTGFCCRVVM